MTEEFLLVFVVAGESPTPEEVWTQVSGGPEALLVLLECPVMGGGGDGDGIVFVVVVLGIIPLVLADSGPLFLGLVEVVTAGKGEIDAPLECFIFFITSAYLALPWALF